MNAQQISTLPEIISIREASEALRVSLMTLRRWDNQGILTAIRPTPSQPRRYRKKDILDFLQLETPASEEVKPKNELYDDIKSNGIHFTPDVLAQFVAQNIVSNYDFDKKKSLKMLDPAIGDGALMKPLLKFLQKKSSADIEVYGFDIKEENIASTLSAITQNFPEEKVYIRKQDFIDYFIAGNQNQFDLVISNPPYIRTQVLGADYSKTISAALGLGGRVDMYYAFLDGIAKVLAPNGIAGVIVSNKFMKNKSGEEVRRRILENFDILHIWDFGDTKIFEAAVLPCVLLLRKKDNKKEASSAPALFTSIYSSSSKQDDIKAFSDPISAIAQEGDVKIGDETYCVKTGTLKYETPSDVWQLSNQENDTWLQAVKDNTWSYFEDVAQIKVGIKTTADEVFIGNEWENLELLQPLTTHKVAQQFRPTKNTGMKVLYTHEKKNGKRMPVNIEKYPHTKKYLESHFTRLNSRNYIHEAKRKWFEIWVPHDPSLWNEPKIVFRDISKEPTFWIDLEGTIVNGDCYWISAKKTADMNLLWLMLAVGNSKFIEEYYDHRFNNKLYAGRRRFMTQYVKKFPLPDPRSKEAQRLVSLAQEIYACEDDKKTHALKQVLNKEVYAIFGL